MCLINFEIVGILYYKHGITQPFQMLIYLIYLRHLLRIHLPATQKQISTLLCVILLLLSNVLWSLERLNLWFVLEKNVLQSIKNLIEPKPIAKLQTF